jgi:thymidylate kinase
VTDEHHLVDRSSAQHLLRNAVPTPEQAACRERALRLVRETLGDEVGPDDVTGSPLGPAWTPVLDVALPPGRGRHRLRAAGWLPLDRLLGPLDAGGELWAVTEGARVLAAVRLLPPGPRPDPVTDLVRRARMHHAVRLRDLLELRSAVAGGATLPAASPVLEVFADVESGLGERSLVRWASGRRLTAPAPLPGRTRPAFVVACSGVDGSGKSSLLGGLERDLTALDLPVSRVWLRPGMGLGRLVVLADQVKRVLRMDRRPGIAAVSADPDRPPPSRRGAVGWLWSLVVVLSFLVGVRRQHRAAHGVVLYDRHLADALATLDFAYAGSDLRLQRWLLRRGTPRADTTFYLDVPVRVAVARKPDDPIGERAVRRQLEVYDAALDGLPGVVRIDGTTAPDRVVAGALRHLCGVPPPGDRS